MRLHPVKLTLVAGLAMAAWIGVMKKPLWEQWLQRYRIRVEGLDTAKPSLAYLMDTQRWLQFEIPGRAPQIKVISNATRPGSLAGFSPDTEWSYAIAYELTDEKRQPICEGVYHFRSRLDLYTNRLDGVVSTANFFLLPNLAPLNSRIMMINMNDPKIDGRAKYLRLRCQNKDADLQDVVLRVYFRSEVPERKLGYQWNRLSKDQKQDLAQGNVYSFEGLSENERLNLLRFHWSGAAPEGIAGRDYQKRTLFVRQDLEGAEAIPQSNPVGLPVASGQWGTIPLPAEAGMLRLLFASPSVDPTPAHKLSLRQFGIGPNQAATQEVVWASNSTQLELTNRAGLIELQTTQPEIVRAYLATATQTNEITPEPSLVMAYPCEPGESVVYAVLHTGGEPALFRLDVRAPSPGIRDSTPPPGVQISFLSDQGKTIWEKRIDLIQPISRYDRLQIPGGYTNVTDPASHLFVLPESIHSVRATAVGSRVLLNAYNRPAGLTKKYRVPLDYYPSQRMDPEQPAWFFLRCPDHEQRALSNRINRVWIQVRPATDDPLVLSGVYEWESFLPRESFRGRNVMLPLAHPPPERMSSLNTLFTPLQLHTRHQIQLAPLPGFAQIRPSIVVHNPSALPSMVSVVVDGCESAWDMAGHSVHEFKLGPLIPGEHEIRVKAPAPITAMINHAATQTSNLWRKRFCVEAESRAYTFAFDKRSPTNEVLVLRIFFPEGRNQPCLVGARLKPPPTRSLGPFDSLTLFRRTWEVQPAGGEPAFVLGAPNQRVDTGQPVFFPLGSDLPPGQYELEISFTQVDRHLFTLSRTTPGEYESRSITIEPQ